jgi:hypothetical protein
MIKKKVKKFIAGQSRYCQNCGVESTELFEVTQNIQKKDQLLYCDKCKSEHKIKKEVGQKNKVVSV